MMPQTLRHNQRRTSFVIPISRLAFAVFLTAILMGACREGSSLSAGKRLEKESAGGPAMSSTPPHSSGTAARSGENIDPYELIEHRRIKIKPDDPKESLMDYDYRECTLIAILKKGKRIEAWFATPTEKALVSYEGFLFRNGYIEKIDFEGRKVTIGMEYINTFTRGIKTEHVDILLTKSI
jgi:hypothetical protein